jgi:hypothetical protein
MAAGRMNLKQRKELARQLQSADPGLGWCIPEPLEST